MDDDLEVVFEANIDQLDAAGSAIDDIFQNIASAAETSGGEITSSLESAAESMDALSEAATQIASGIEEGVDGATEALDSLPAAGEEASSSLSDSISSSAEGFTSLQDAISSLTDSVTSAVSEINDQVESIGTNAEESAAATESSFSGIDLSGAIGGAGMLVFGLQAVGNMAMQAGQDLLGPAEAAESTQASFTNLLGSTTAAANELNDLNNFAAKTQFKTQDIDNAAASLIAFKTPARDIVPDLTAVGDALTAVGKGTPAEMQGVVDILGKIGVQGKLTQGDITQMGAHGIDAMSAIEKGGDLSATALQSMIKNGTLPAKDAIADLTKGIEENPVYSGGMAKQAQTLSGQMSTLASTWDQTLAAFGKPIVKDLEGDVGKLGTAISSPAFKTFAGVVGKEVVIAFTDIGKAVENAGQFFDNPAFKQLAALLSGDLSTDVKQLADYFDSPAFGNFAKVMGEDVGGALLTTTQDIEKLVGMGEDVYNFFKNNADAMNLLKAALAATGIVLGALIIPALIEAAIDMGIMAVEALILEAPFILLGIGIAAVIFGILEAIEHWSQIQAAFGSTTKAVMGGVGSFFGSVGHDIEGIFGDIGQAAENVGNAISGAFRGGINGVIEGINWLIDAVDSFNINVPALVVGGVTVFGGANFGLGYIPTIPLLARGGTVAPGQYAIAGEAGAELVYGGTSGASVMSASQTASMMNGGGGETHVHIYLDGKEMTNMIMTKAVKVIRAQGGRMVAA